jgi:hypothetical protein
MRSKAVLSATLVLAALVGMTGLTGCAGYRLGSMLPPDIKSVYVPTFVNKTKEPLLEVETTSATIEEFQVDGSLKIADANTADAVLEVTLVDFDLDPISFRKDEETAAREYRMNITATVVLRRTSDNVIVAEAPRVVGDTTFQLLGNLTSSKLRALPAASEDLAHKIVEQVVETWQ